MATREELFAAVRLIRNNCEANTEYECYLNCPLQPFCNRYFNQIPDEWPDPEEGGGEE